MRGNLAKGSKDAVADVKMALREVERERGSKGVSRWVIEEERGECVGAA